MNVIRTIPSFYPKVTGPAHQVYEVSRRLNEYDVSTTILTSTEGAEDQPLNDWMDGISIRRCSPLLDSLPYKVYPRAALELVKNRGDIIHSHGYRNSLSDVAYIYSKISEKPFILHAHGTFLGYKHILEGGSDWKYEIYDITTRKQVAKDADSIIVSTNQEKQEAISFGIDSDKIRVIPVGKSVDKYTSAPKTPPEDSFRLLFVGRLDRSRNVEQVIKSLPHLPSKVKLRVVGGEATRSGLADGDYLESLKQISKDFDVIDRVTFAGPKYDQDLIREYRSAHLFIYTSKYENFGQTILEAAAAGLPVISTPVGVANEIVRDGETGYLIGKDNIQSTIEAVKNILDQDVVLMGKQIQGIVRDEYTWENVAKEYDDLYRAVVKSADLSQ